MKGLCGRLLRINLARGSINVEDVDEAVARKYLGGKALAAYYAIREIKNGIDPLGPDNNLYLFTGTLTGTPAPLGNRTVAATKSPLTGTFTDSYLGGFWGPELKFAGYDGIILEGISPGPVHIQVQDDDVRIVDAKELWGMDTWRTTEAVKKGLGATKKPARVMSIGQAGERKDLLAAIIADARAAARGGVGAVMGSKKVKAISVIGSKRPALHDQKGMMALVKADNARLNKNPVTNDALRYRGTANILLGVNAVGALPYNDFSGDENPGADLISGEAMQKTLWNDGKNWHACWNCVVKCTHYHVLEQPGFEGKVDDGPEYETTGLLGSNCGINDLKAIALADYLLDGYGLDTMSVGGTIAFLMDCYGRGLIGMDMTNGLDLKFGDLDAWMAAINAAGLGEGNLGRLVANGVLKAAEEIGHDSMDFAPHVKGMELPAYDPRSGEGTALSYARCERGADHLKPWVFHMEWLSSAERVEPFTTEDKPALIKRENEGSALFDCLCVCRFAGNELNMEDLMALTNAATGFNYTFPEFWAVGERAINLARAFGARDGLGRAQDTLPKKFADIPLREGLAKGSVAHVDLMLSKYYEICGWDDNGVPMAEKLHDLDLGFVVDELAAAGRSVETARAA